MGASSSRARRATSRADVDFDPRADLRAHAASDAEGRRGGRRASNDDGRGAIVESDGGATTTTTTSAARTHKTTTIRNHVNLNKSTLECVTSDGGAGGRSGGTPSLSSGAGANKFGITFKVDADKACRVSVAYVARELPGGAFEPASTHPIARTNPKGTNVAHLEAGLGARFTQGAEDYVDVRSFGGERELTTTNVDAKTYPVVIRLECVSSDAEANHGKTLADLPENPIGGLAKPEPWVQCQTTYAEFRRETSAPRKWTAHVTKQKIYVHGSSYELQEIYGIESCDNVGLSSADVGEECVICLTEPRDTTVLPCRHLCMCAECAHALRSQLTGNVCPICRNPVESLLEIKVAGDAAP